MKDSITVRDNRTGKEYELPITSGTIKAADLKQIKASDSDDLGLATYDPGLFNTDVCKSKITFIDGDKGILRYRGYPIEELADKKEYLEVAYLLLHGELPTSSEYKEWKHNITYHTNVHENIKKFFDGYNYDAHPMGMLVSSLAALSTFYPDAKKIFDEKSRQLQIL